MPHPPYILIVEDDAAITLLLTYNLTQAGFEVSTAGTGKEALEKINARLPDAIILDWMLPVFSGIEVCQKIRATPHLQNLPILMLTARNKEEDTINSFTSGADDFVTKPFSITPLILRLRALLKRSHPAQNHHSPILTFHDVTMNLQEHKVQRGQRNILLGPTEFKMLELFLRNPRRVFSRNDLLNILWSAHNINVEARTIDVHIRRLRRELNAENEPDIIRTIRSAGYALDLVSAS
ncbi:response regulator [Entomobacter blattae]|uniref:response regulator n=1 Tax=Entomobacter blattae TaxID=2762277 RepID=UPI001EF0DEF7|nr:response regulator [Entomobacter blattae]